jgi:hypothetical protein
MCLMRWHWKRKDQPVGFAAVLWISVYLLARGILELPNLPTAVRVLTAVAPTPLFVWLLTLIQRSVSQMDELERRIQLEALAMAFPLVFVLLMTLGLLELAVPLNPDDWSYRHVWALLPSLYFLGLSRARRRYQ